MLRKKSVIGRLYNLGLPRSRSTQAQSDIVCFLSGRTRGCYHTTHWYPTKEMKEEDNIFLVDHVDYFKKDITLIPYLSIEKIHDEIAKSNRWKLAISKGLSYKVLQPDNSIYVEKNGFWNANLVILHCEDWLYLRKEMRRSLFDQYLSENPKRAWIYKNVKI